MPIKKPFPKHQRWCTNYTNDALNRIQCIKGNKPNIDHMYKTKHVMKFIQKAEILLHCDYSRQHIKC